MWHLPREIFDLAIESLNKVKDWKNTDGDCEKKAFKWEINIKILKKPKSKWSFSTSQM